MELISLLNQRNWDSSKDLTKSEIEEAMRQKISVNIKKLYRSYHRGILLSSFFLLFFIAIYLINQSIEFLIPVLLISAVYTFIISNIVFHLLRGDRLNPSENLKTAIVEMLEFDKKLYSRQCRYNQVILLISFIGGFLLGLAYQGWTLDKYLEKPIIFPVLIALSLGFYYLTKSQSFGKLNRLLNPEYHKAKSFLKNQLELIVADD